MCGRSSLVLLAAHPAGSALLHEASSRLAAPPASTRRRRGGAAAPPPPTNGGRSTLSEPLLDLRVCFEPIVRLRDCQPVSHELLLRPANGGRLQDQAEKAGVPMTWITEFALRSAGAVLERAVAPIHVNVVPDDLTRPTFITELRTCVGERALPLLVLEVTEEAELIRDDALRTSLVELRRLGIRFAIDDLGDGWATVDNVKFLQPEIIKIRLDHLRGTGGEADAKALTALAAKHLADVVVEQVENADDVALVRSLGMSHAQGWYWDGQFPGPAPTPPG